MKRFTNVLAVPVTASSVIPSETAQAVELAVENGAELTAFGVIPQPSRAERLLHLGRHTTSVGDLLEAGMEVALRSWASQFSDRIAIGVRIADGPPPIEIVREVLRSDVDLVVVTTDGSADAETTVKRVFRKCPCPVWFVRPSHLAGPVLAAVDPDDDPALNSTILELASTQARRRSSKLHVVHAWRFHGESTLLAADYTLLGPGAIREYHDEVEDAHRGAFQELLAGVGLSPTPVAHLVEQKPVTAIETLAGRLGAGLLVMGAVGRSVIDGALMGNTAERVLGSIDCSVVVVKPPGFVSPVTTPPRAS